MAPWSKEERAPVCTLHMHVYTHTQTYTQAQAHTHQGLILTEGRHLPSYFHFLSPRLCWLLSNREASFPGSGMGGREGVEGSGKRRNQACLDIPDGAFLQYTPPPPTTHTLLTGLKVCRAVASERQRRERGTRRGKSLAGDSDRR